MKGYLLDTHILLWWLSEPERLPGPVGELIRKPRHAVYVSAAAVWEMAIKKTLGRLDMPGNLPQVLQQERIGMLPIDVRHALAVADLPLLHQDPFDRMQLVQALLEGLTLISHDLQILQYDVPTLAV